MKRAALSILTVFLALLIPAALMAQTDYGQQPANELQEPTADEQRRTNPDAESWGPGQGLTITGTVESVNNEAIQIRTTTGIQNIVLADDTRKPVNLQVGDRVAIDYLRNTQGVMIAQEIRPEGTPGTTTGQDTAGTTTGTGATGMHEQHATGTGTTGLRQDTTAMETDTDLDVEVGAEAETGIADVDVTRERETDTMALQNEQDTMDRGTLDQDTTYDQGSLPATASNLPALALLGLLAFAGAIAIRTGLR